MQNQQQTILGIDPGTNIMGYGIICAKDTTISLVKMDILKINAKKNQLEKLIETFDFVSHLIATYQPDSMAIETQFLGKNIQSMLKLGRAQGVAIAAALHKNIPVFEYAPTKIKAAVTGRNNSTKEQVAAMLQYVFQIESIPTFDATDALAIAYCHYLQNANIPIVQKHKTKKNSWKHFVEENKNRIIK